MNRVQHCRWAESRIVRGRIARGTFVFAAIALLLNDRVFKWGTALPSWLTGKLSDFLGLLVAPLMLCLVFRARSRRARLPCFAIPAALFVATEVSARAAGLAETLLNATGMSWRLWPDPTDLLALLVLPLGWTLSRWLAEQDGHESTPRVRQHFQVVVGAAACLGSGDTGDAHHANVYLVNRTGERVEVDVAEMVGSLDCSAFTGFQPGLLRHEDFVPRIRYAVEPNGVVPFHGCAPVRVSVGGVTSGIQWSGALPSRALPNVLSVKHLANESQLVFVERQADATVLRFGPNTESFSPSDNAAPIPTSECEQLAIPRLEVSGSTNSFTGTILSKQDLGAGCFSLAVGDPDSSSGAPGWQSEQRKLQLCMPESEFPFALGDQVSISGHRIALALGGLPRLTLHIGANFDFPIEHELTPSECGQVRDRCGAVWQPLDLYVQGTYLPPGRRQSVEAQGYPRRDYYLVRAMRSVLARRTCGPDLDRPGTHLEVIEQEGLN